MTTAAHSETKQPKAASGPLFRAEEFLVGPQTSVDLAALPTHQLLAGYGKRKLRKALRRQVARFAHLQGKLFAENRRALLLVFHGMDAAGKDSTIKYVTAGVNSQGFRVAQFSRPSATELEHTWLHRHWVALPGRGRIGIFNRSHYEEVVTVRVNPQLLAARKLAPEQADGAFWEERLRDIVAFESHLARNGIRIVKFLLNISQDEQRRRIVKRLHDPKRNWKYDPSDLAARDRWDDYRGAFEAALQATSTDEAPWYVVPADHKPTARVIVASIIVQTMERMDPRFPVPDAELSREIEVARRILGSS